MNTTQSIKKSQVKDRARADVSVEISKIGVYAIGISAGIIGCWATVCLVAGTVTSGGPIELLNNLMKVIIG